MVKLSGKKTEVAVMKDLGARWNMPVNFSDFNANFAYEAKRWKKWEALAAELLAFRSWYDGTYFVCDGKAQKDFKLPSRHDIAFAKRPDLNFAIMEFRKDHIAVEKRMRYTPVKAFEHDEHGKGRTK